VTHRVRQQTPEEVRMSLIETRVVDVSRFLSPDEIREPVRANRARAYVCGVTEDRLLEQIVVQRKRRDGKASLRVRDPQVASVAQLLESIADLLRLLRARGGRI